MTTPNRTCKECGERVVEKDVYDSGSDRFVAKLVHVDADGKTLFQDHRAIEEVPS